jgi:hypothetical protein
MVGTERYEPVNLSSSELASERGDGRVVRLTGALAR